MDKDRIRRNSWSFRLAPRPILFDFAEASRRSFLPGSVFRFLFTLDLILKGWASAKKELKELFLGARRTLLMTQTVRMYVRR